MKINKTKYNIILLIVLFFQLNVKSQNIIIDNRNKIIREIDISIPKAQLLTPKMGEGNYPDRCYYPINDNGDIEYKKVIECNLLQKELYSNFQKWIIKTFLDYKKVVQLEDESSGKIILKGSSKVKKETSTESIFGFLSNKEMLVYTITLEAKDGRYRYTISDIYVIIYGNDKILRSSRLDDRCISLKKASASVIKDIEEWIDSEKEQIIIIENSLKNDLSKSSEIDF